MSGLSDLHLGEETTALAGSVLGVGFRRIAREHFRHAPPTPLEIEGAIAAIEDEIARTQPPRGVRLVSSDAVVRDIALAAGVPPGLEMVLAREAVEQLFERSLRRPPDNDRMAAVLILRELMHHLDLASVAVRAP